MSKSDYCLQLDSHVILSPSYDTRLLDMHARTNNADAVLSTYVNPLIEGSEAQSFSASEVPNLCMVTFTSTVRNWGTKACKNLIRPKLTNLWAAGLSFSPCEAALVVPYDPYLDNVFDGEEYSYWARLFTWGYDVYTPDGVVVLHDYQGHQGNRVVHTWGRKRGLRGGGGAPPASVDPRLEKATLEIEAARGGVDVKGTARVNALLAGSDPALAGSRYGLGGRRTLESALEFSGVDVGGGRMRPGNRCGNLDWVEPRVRGGGRLEEALGRSTWPGRRGRAGAGAKGQNVVKEEEMTPGTDGRPRVTDNEMRVGGAAAVAALLLVYLFGGRRGKTKRGV